MYTVIIADDDVNIREGLEVLIDWEEYGFSIVGKAANGTQALRLITSLEPDVVIIDVRMPGMDGLSVIRTLGKSSYAPHFLIVSAYDEFAYAKAALVQGVENYLLKPIDPDELRESLIAIAESTEGNSPSYVLADTDDYAEVRSHVLRRLLYGGIDSRQLDERMSVLGLHPGMGPYRTVAFQLRTTDARRLRSAMSTVCGTFRADERQAFADYTGLVGVLLHRCPDRGLVSRRAYEVVRLLSANDESTVGVVGPAIDRLSMIHRSFTRAVEVLEATVAHPQPEVFVAEEFSIPDSEFQRFEAAALSGALATADHSAVEAYFADLERRFADTEDSEVIRAASIVIGSTCASFMAGKDIGRRRIFPLLAPNAADEEIGSMESLLVTFRDLGRRIVEHLRRGVTRPDDTSAKLLNRVRERITDPNLYLKAIAAELGISSAYAGRLFYEETGLHFSHYLNKRRIALAIERMEAGETSTARLASAVGYADPKYFSRVFKRITGRSPTKYLQTLARPDGEASPRQFG